MLIGKWRRGWILFAMMVFVLAGCQADGEVSGDLFDRYKGAYVGHASQVSHIVRGAPGGERVSGITLHTEAAPYGVIVHVNGPVSEQLFQEIVVYQAAFLFALVQNADWVKVEMEDQDETITREQFAERVGKDVWTFTNEAELRAFIEKHLQAQG